MRAIKQGAVLLGLLGACASYPQPTDSLTQSVGAARGAKEAGAEAIPDAALHLRLANEQNAEAQRLMKEGDNGRAAFVTRRAESDAVLALALTREKQAQERVAAASPQTPPGSENPGSTMPDAESPPTSPGEASPLPMRP